jgi:hypothetical protein
MPMKTISVAAFAAIAFGALCAGMPARAAVVLATGWYEEDVQILTAKNSNKNGTCPEAPGEVFSRHVFYPGPDKTGYFSNTAVDAAHHGPGILRSAAVGPTPAAGATSWGSAAHPISSDDSFTTEAGTFVSTSSFFSTFKTPSSTAEFAFVTLKIVSGDGTNDGCVETFDSQNVFTGAN